MFYLSRSTLAAMFGKITAVLGVIQVLFYLSVLSLYAESVFRGTIHNRKDDGE